MAGWLAGRQAVQNPGDFLKFLEFIIDRNNQLFALFNKCITVVPMHLSRFFG